jgi:osmotically inducible protein OsmC
MIEKHHSSLREFFMRPVGATSMKMFRPRPRSRPRFFGEVQVEHEDEYDDEDDFQRSRFTILNSNKEIVMQRKASAQWQGDLKTGKGNISTESGVLSKTQYSFSTRFENGVGTNPEELIGAAHAGCFSMALSGQLGGAGMTAESIDTTATVTMEKLDAGFTVTKVHLDVRAKIPGADAAAFQAAANRAKEGCPISRLLNATITMDAKLN